MPVNLLSVAFTWFATHLVILSLLGFLVIGLFVFGLVGSTGPASVAQKKTLPAPTQPRPHGAADPTAAKSPESTGSTAVSPVDPGRDRRKNEMQRPQPWLIGGSLPNYAQQGLPLSPPGAVPGGNGNFRPSAEDPGTVALGMMTREDYIQQARRAFWNGDFETAEAAYMALLSEYPTDADAFGELGNLYQAMGSQERALDAYFEAAVRLKAAGDSDKLKHVMELLTSEGDPRVDQLRP